MDAELARKRKLSTSGRPVQGEPTSTGTGHLAYYNSTNPPAASLETFVSSVNAGALSQSNQDLDDRAPRPVKKKRTNEAEGTNAENGRQKTADNSAVQPGIRLPATTGTTLFPVRRAESVLLTVNAGASNADKSRGQDEDSDNDASQPQSANPGNRARSSSNVRNPPTSGKARSKIADEEDRDRGCSAGPGGRGAREGSVSFSGNEGGASGKKGKRNRVHFSCVEVCFAIRGLCRAEAYWDITFSAIVANKRFATRVRASRSLELIRLPSYP